MVAAHIIRVVGRYFHKSSESLVSKQKSVSLVRPRQIAAYLTRELTGASYPDIGRAFGGRDHTTIMYAHRKITALVARNSSVADHVKQLRAALTNGTDAVQACCESCGRPHQEEQAVAGLVLEMERLRQRIRQIEASRIFIPPEDPRQLRLGVRS